MSTPEQRLTELEDRIALLETLLADHSGLDAAFQGPNYPHPNMSIATVEFGSQGNMRISDDGLTAYPGTDGTQYMWQRAYPYDRTGIPPTDLIEIEGGKSGVYDYVSFPDNGADGRRELVVFADQVVGVAIGQAGLDLFADDDDGGGYAKLWAITDTALNPTQKGYIRLGQSATHPEFSVDDSTYQNIALASDIPSGAVTKTVISTLSKESIGVDLAADGGGVNSATWPSANLAIIVPFQLEESVTFTKMGFRVAVQSGNYDIGIYNEAYAKQVSTGQTAVPAVGLAEADITNTTLAPGRYYFALAFDNTTVSTARAAPISTVAAMMGLAQMASAFPLPSTFTPATMTSGYAPIIAASIRTLLG